MSGLSRTTFGLLNNFGRDLRDHADFACVRQTLLKTPRHLRTPLYEVFVGMMLEAYPKNDQVWVKAVAEITANIPAAAAYVRSIQEPSLVN